MSTITHAPNGGGAAADELRRERPWTWHLADPLITNGQVVFVGRHDG